jgi:hypothetical protein
MINRGLRTLVVVFSVLSLSHSQSSPTGKVGGTVVDISGALVSGVAVSLKNVDTGWSASSGSL